MTINSEVRVAGPFLGNDATVAFPFAFKVFDADEVLVVLEEAGAETVLELSADYTVTLNADQEAAPGGQVTLVAGALALGKTLTLTSALAPLQPVDLTNQGGFYPRVINTSLDRLTILVQQLSERLSRTLVAPISDGGAGFGDLPGVSVRKGSVLAFDEVTGAPQVGPNIAAVGTVAANTAAVNAVAANLADVGAVAANLADVTNFADIYYGPSANDPTTRRDGSPLQQGDLYFNTTIDALRSFNGSAWRGIPNGAITVQNLSGDGIETEFLLDYAPENEAVTSVFISGVYQQKNTYELGGAGGAWLIFDEAPPAGADNIEVVVSALQPSDDKLRQDLANATDPAKGAALLGYKGRTLGDKLKEWISVTDFGVVADGVTDNTAAYSAMIAALPAGSTIYWPKGTYVGDFISGKPFILRGNGSTLIGVGNFAVISFQGTLGPYQNLSTAPKYGDISLSGVTGLTGDTMVLLYSGNTRPNDAAQVNFEVLKIKSDGTVYDKVYSAQNGGTPRYAVVTPIKGVEIYGFEFEMGSSTAHGIFIRYAENVYVGNIGMTGGSATTVDVRNTINATIDHVRRIKPSATGSGQGYNVALNVTKYVKVDRVYGEETRHDFDQDSSYVTDVSGVISVNCLSASILLAHTGFGGFTSVRDCTIRSDAYAIATSDQVNGGASLMFRHLVIDNINITNNKNMTASDFYVGIYLQYPTENVSIKNVTFKNVNNAASFNYAGGLYNNAYFAIRTFRPDGVFDVENVVVDSATEVVRVDNISSADSAASGVTVKNLKVDRFRDIVVVINVLLAGRGDVSVEDVKFYESSSDYGQSIVAVLSTSNRLRTLMVRGLSRLPFFTKTVYLQTNAGCPFYSYIDTAGFTRRLSNINSLTAGGTITQSDYLTRGDFALWAGTSITLSATVPIERPVTSGNIFAIFNGGSGSLTIPANSTTVNNTTDIVVSPGETHYFMANSTGTKWLRYKKETGTTL